MPNAQSHGAIFLTYGSTLSSLTSSSLSPFSGLDSSLSLPTLMDTQLILIILYILASNQPWLHQENSHSHFLSWHLLPVKDGCPFMCSFSTQLQHLPRYYNRLLDNGKWQDISTTVSPKLKLHEYRDHIICLLLHSYRQEQ